MAGREWTVEFHPKCEQWARDLPSSDAEALLAAIRVLRDLGPSLGRPLVDTVKASRHPNMKELRPGSTGRTEIRVLFAFDRARMAILLVGGDKSAAPIFELRRIKQSVPYTEWSNLALDIFDYLRELNTGAGATYQRKNNIV